MSARLVEEHRIGGQRRVIGRGISHLAGFWNAGKAGQDAAKRRKSAGHAGIFLLQHVGTGGKIGLGPVEQPGIILFIRAKGAEDGFRMPFFDVRLAQAKRDSTEKCERAESGYDALGHVCKIPRLG